jgi:hypothetical protein
MICLTDQIGQRGDRRGKGGYPNAHGQILVGLGAFVGDPSVGYVSSHPFRNLKGFFPSGID